MLGLDMAILRHPFVTRSGGVVLGCRERVWTARITQHARRPLTTGTWVRVLETVVRRHLGLETDPVRGRLLWAVGDRSSLSPRHDTPWPLPHPTKRDGVAGADWAGSQGRCVWDPSSFMHVDFIVTAWRKAVEVLICTRPARHHSLAPVAEAIAVVVVDRSLRLLLHPRLPHRPPLCAADGISVKSHRPALPPHLPDK